MESVRQQERQRYCMHGAASTRGAGKCTVYLVARAHAVLACELFVTTAEFHALAVLSEHALDTYGAAAERGKVQVAHGGSARICSNLIT